jgi:hypothetical protein
MIDHRLIRLSQIAILFLGLINLSAFSQPAEFNLESSPNYHYIVFVREPEGEFIPVYYRLVALSAPLKSLTGGQVAGYLAQPSRNEQQVVVELQSEDNRVVFRDVVEISPWLRAEFHGKTEGSPIDGKMLPDETPAFVVRVPAVEASSILLQNSRLETVARYELDSLVSNTPHIVLAPGLSVAPQSMTGGSSNRVDLLLMSEGYTEAEAGKFDLDALDIAGEFFSIPPYSIYQNYFNIFTIFNPSDQSGADHPPYDTGCAYNDATCCGDPSMQNDPQQGTMVSTAYDSRYCAYWIYRLLVVNQSKVLAAAAAFPDWDTILVIVNDPTYGGSGGALSVVSTNASGVQIAQHEFGHSFVDLADEYESAYPGFPTCSDINGPACESNVTDVTDRLQLKWNSWIFPTTPIPTPEYSVYSPLVGSFEGARFLSSGMYRSGLNCIMRSLGAPYCQVPSQSFVMKLYEGGWGNPDSGINLIEPGSALPAMPLEVIGLGAQTFHAEVLSPLGGPPVQMSWMDNGLLIPGEHEDTLDYLPSPLKPGIHEITLQVKDATTLVHPEFAGEQLADKFSWQVIVPPTQLFFLPFLAR